MAEYNPFSLWASAASFEEKQYFKLIQAIVTRRPQGIKAVLEEDKTSPFLTQPPLQTGVIKALKVEYPDEIKNPIKLGLKLSYDSEKIYRHENSTTEISPAQMVYCLGYYSKQLIYYSAQTSIELGLEKTSLNELLNYAQKHTPSLANMFQRGIEDGAAIHSAAPTAAPR